MLHLRHSNAALALVAACLLASAAAVTHRVTVCDDRRSVQRLSCGDGNVISVQKALFGRTDTTTCSQGRFYSQLANTKCIQEGTVDLIKKRCNGKKVCEVNTRVACIRDPCPGTYKYLETEYTCVPAHHVIVCQGSSALLQCDGGQRINVTAADYGRSDQNTCAFMKTERQTKNTNCHLYTTKVADSCNRKEKCTVSALDSVFGRTCSCTRKYLEVAYTCNYPEPE